MIERKTVISENILKIFKETNNPISAGNIIDTLSKKDIAPNKATVYRILNKLKSSQQICEFTIKNGTSFFELNKHNHHHHFICNTCSTVYCLDHCHLDTNDIKLSQLLPNKHFKVNSHEFNIYGTCEPCSTEII